MRVPARRMKARHAASAPSSRAARKALLMPEVPHPREHHREAVLVGGGDHLVVAHAAAGWITAFAPAPATTSRPSRNGKNASEAATEPRSDRPAFFALIAAMRVESTRLIWPAPTPSVMPPAQKTMAFDFTNLATR